MGKGSKIKPDTILKSYWADNNHFADLFNTVVFNGQTLIDASRLEDVDTNISIISEQSGQIESVELTRDIIKIEKCERNTNYVFLGLENQMGIHYAMPFRVMEYDVYAYRKQYEAIKAKYPKKQGLSDSNEFLSHMRKIDYFCPVITLVVYFGRDPWDGPKSLKDMLNIPFELEQYVPEYPMNLLEVRDNEFLFSNENNRKLFELLKIMNSNRFTWKEKQEVISKYQENNVIDLSVARVLTAIHKGNNVFGRERIDTSLTKMVFEEVYEDGRARSIVEIGEDLGWTEDIIVDTILAKLDISEQEAKEFYNTYTNKV